MREDTSPETPYAKSNSDPPPANPWRPPGSPGADGAESALFSAMANGARFDWGIGAGKVRTFRASGVAGAALAILVLIAMGALISVFFVFAIGVGTAFALGAGAVGALGLGANMFRRRLPSAGQSQLGPHNE